MPETPDLRTELAAYLAGDLDDAASSALEARIDSEPWVANELDRMADLAIELGGVDDVDVPEGFGDRLRAGLSEAIGHELPDSPSLDDAVVRSAGAAAASRWSTPHRRDASRPTVARSNRRRTAVAVAATVAVLFIGSTAVLLTGTGDDARQSGVQEAAVDDAAVEDRSLAEDEGQEGDFAGSAPSAGEEATGAELPAMDALEEAPAEEEAMVEEAEELADEADDQADEAATPAATSAPAPTSAADGTAPPAGGEPSRFAPAVLDLRGLQPDDEVLRNQVAAHPAATSLLERDADDAAELADPFRDELLRDPSFPDGTPPGRCLVEVLRSAGESVIPAVSALLGPEPDSSGQSLAFALARSSDESRIDTIDVWVVDTDDCGILAVVS